MRERAKLWELHAAAWPPLRRQQGKRGVWSLFSGARKVAPAAAAVSLSCRPHLGVKFSRTTWSGQLVKEVSHDWNTQHG